MRFSTINESGLHKTLKTYYAVQTNGKTEVNLYNHVFDIVTDKNEIIEIQTQNLAKLLPKCLDTIDKGLSFRIIYPLIHSKRIEIYNEEGKKISSRNSPKKKDYIDIFEELTGIYPVLLNPNFTLEIVKVKICEKRVKTEKPVQSKNNKRRFLRNWIKVNKTLEEIIETKTLKNKGDYFSLLPDNLPQEFSAKILASHIDNKTIPSKGSLKNAYLIIWVLNKMKLIELTKVEKRCHYYKFLNI